MGIYNFKEQFVPMIMSGEKTHTIRGIRAHPDKAGNTLHLYTGLRQKGARLLMRVKCSKVETIRIIPLAVNDVDVFVGDIALSGSEKETLAQRDGFANFACMVQFWLVNNGLPFSGQIIHWRNPIQ